MRVLHVNAGNLYGGVETLLVTLARERACYPEMEPRFALCFPGRLADELAAAGTSPALLGEVQTRYPWQVWRARRRLAALLRAGHFNAVVCHQPWSLALFGPVVRSAGLPLVFWMHGVASGRHWVERWARRCPPDQVICNSHFTSQSLPRLFPRRTPPHTVVYCPVAASGRALSAEERAAVRAEFKTSADAIVFVQVGRLEPWKGHTEHLMALAGLAALPGWTCWIVGGAQRQSERSYLDKLQAQVSAARIADRVRFLGERNDISVLLGAADVFCQPNLASEPFGLVFAEALAAGLPVVTTVGGGAAEIVDESCGRLLARGDAAALRSALAELATHSELREALGKNGLARVHARLQPATAMRALHEALVQAARCNSERSCRAQPFLG